MPTEAQIEAAARAMFYLSWGAKFGVYHWPGDAPKPCLDPHSEGAMTVSADDPSAPGNGKGPDELRAIAQRVLEAAENA